MIRRVHLATLVWLLSPAIAYPSPGGANVMTDYHAAGDCRTDDQAAIQSAMNNAADNPQHGGRVYLPAPPGGCYLLKSTLVFPPSAPPYFLGGVQLVGDGEGATILRAGSSMQSVVESSAKYVRGDGLADLTVDAGGFADYAIWVRKSSDFQVATSYALNARVADMRIDGENTRLVDSRLWNQEAVFPTPKDMPPYNLLLRGSDNIVTGTVFVNAAMSNYEDEGANNIVSTSHSWNMIKGFTSQSFGRYGFTLNNFARAISNTSDDSAVAGFNVVGPGVSMSSNLAQWGHNAAPQIGILVEKPRGNAATVGNQVNGTPAERALVTREAGADPR